MVPKPPEYRLFQYKTGYIGSCVRNCVYNTPGYSSDQDEQFAQQVQKDFDGGGGRWLTEWLPLPVKE